MEVDDYRGWEDLKFQEEQGKIVDYWTEIELTKHYEDSVATVASQEFPNESAQVAALDDLLREDLFCKERLDKIEKLQKKMAGSASESVIVGV